MDREQLIKYIIAPTLHDMKCWSQPAEDLLVMIAAHESLKGKYIHQRGNGPACGIFQMELVPHSDILKFLKNDRPALYLMLERYTGLFHHSLMDGNLYYATFMARAFFLRFPESIPLDYIEMAKYAKDKWNTYKGKATWEDYHKAFKEWK